MKDCGIVGWFVEEARTDVFDYSLSDACESECLD